MKLSKYAWIAVVPVLGALLGRKSRRRPRRTKKRPCSAIEDRGVLSGTPYRSYSPASPSRPPIVFFHGRGGDEDIMFGQLAGIKLDALQLYPRGPVPMGKYAAWTQARSTDADWGDELEAVLPAAAAMLEEVRRCFGTPVVAGHSQGGHMAFALAARYPHLVRSAIGASGALPEGMWGRFEVPVTAIHGTADPVVPYARTADMAEASGAELVAIDGHQHSLSGQLQQAFNDAVLAAAG